MIQKLADQLIADLKYPSSFVSLVVRAIQEQLSDYRSQTPLLQEVGGECRANIKVAVKYGSVSYTDSFEFDLLEPRNDPAAVAEQIGNDLGLSGEFIQQHQKY